MKDDELKNLLSASIKNAEGGTNSQLMQDRAEAERYYVGRPKPDQVINGSQVIATEISAAVEAQLSNMMGALNSDCLATFKPTGPDDEDQSAMESAVVQNKLFNNGYMTFQAVIKDALILRNGYLKVWIDETEKVESKDAYFPTAKDAALAIAGLEKENTEQESITVKAVKGKPNTLRITKKTIYQEPKMQAVPPENISYTPNWPTHIFDDVPFFAERHQATRSDLIKMGLDKKTVNDLEAFSSSTFDPLKDIRQRETDFQKNHPEAMKALDVIEYYECYVLYDADDDGVVERHRVLYSARDNVILEDELVSPYVPYVTAIALLRSHSAQGMSMYDKLKNVQDISTGLHRALQNNTAIVNRQRVIFNTELVDGDDVTDPDPFASIPVSGKGPVQDAVATINAVDLTQGILMNIEHQHRVRDELGGSALQMSSGQTQMSSAMGSQGVDRMYSAQEQLVALMTQNIVETMVRPAFLLMHKVLRENWIGALKTNMSGIWVETTPSEWPQRQEATIKVGMSIGERQRVTSATGELIKAQQYLMSSGKNGILVTDKNYYNAMIDWCRQNYITNPERFLINPESDESKAAAQRQSQAQQQERTEGKGLLAHSIKLQEIELAYKKYGDELQAAVDLKIANLQESVKLLTAENASLVDLVKTKLTNDVTRELKDGLSGNTETTTANT